MSQPWGAAHGRGAGFGEGNGEGFRGLQQMQRGQHCRAASSPAEQQIAPTGCLLGAAPNQTAHPAVPRFAVPFRPTARLGRDPGTLSVCNARTLPRAELRALNMEEEISVCTALLRKKESGRAGPGPE